jgi:LmbE family N-acetylglucosaminyl deacetylase
MFLGNKILVLAPHTDDGEFGCGASVAKFIKEGKDVMYAAFSIAEDSVPDPFPVDILETEVVEATNALGLSHFDLSIHKYPVRQLGGSGRRFLRTW